MIRQVDVRALLERLEGDPEPRPALAWLAAQELDLDDGEVRASLRRALLLLAAGGDPRRALDPEGRAVRAVAADLATPDRRAGLRTALVTLRGGADGLPRVAAAADALAADEEAASRWLACALLAEELAGDEE